MRLSTRVWLTAVPVIACLLLLMAFVGSASASGLRPRISVTPHHAFADVNGCITVKISGSGFTHSTTTISNTADFTGQDSVGYPLTFNPDAADVNANGNFSTLDTVCSPAAPFLPNDTFTICAIDDYSGLSSNCVNVRVD
jgi:hypothetical protein